MTEVPAGVAVPGHVREVAGVVAPHAPHPVQNLYNSLEIDSDDNQVSGECEY